MKIENHEMKIISASESSTETEPTAAECLNFRFSVFRFSIFILQFSIWLGASTAQERDINYNTEQQTVESARHLFRMEGDASAARLRLIALLSESRNEEVQTQARFLLGRIFEESGEKDSALAAYRQALSGKGLGQPEKLWLYKRLMVLNPSSIQPLAADHPAKTGPARVFTGKSGKRTVYTLEFRGPPDGQWERAKELGIQDANGRFQSLDIRLSGREEVLDADADHALILNQESRKVSLVPLKGGKSHEDPAGARVEVGTLLPGEAG